MLKRLVEGIFYNKTLMLLVLGFALLASIFIDSRNAIVAPSDMRNRIVGSRMLEDGLSPYYYIWKEGGPVRYYDWHNWPTALVSAVTSTPFYHWISIPVADLPQFQINVLWFCLSYVFLGACWLFIALSLPPPRYRSLLLLTAVTILFTYTTGWRMHLTVGQNYILLPAMMAGCYYCFTQKQNGLHLLLFGLFAASLILLRPLAALVFVPFLFYLKPYIRWFACSAVWMAAYGLFVWLSPVQQKNWKEYFSSVQVNVQLHQELLTTPSPPASYNPVPIPAFEGVDFNSRGNEYWATQIRRNIECSNFYIFYEGFLGHKPSIAMQTFLGTAAGLLVLLPLWGFRKKRIPITVETLLIIGFILYNTYEFFAPITRNNYVFVQFIFPLLLLVVSMKRLYMLPVLALLVGMYVNIITIPIVKMEHNIGQFLMVAAMLWLVYRPLLATRFPRLENRTITNGPVWL